MVVLVFIDRIKNIAIILIIAKWLQYYILQYIFTEPATLHPTDALQKYIRLRMIDYKLMVYHESLKILPVTTQLL